jgi:hypothetical protein
MLKNQKNQSHGPLFKSKNYYFKMVQPTCYAYQLVAKELINNIRAKKRYVLLRVFEIIDDL